MMMIFDLINAMSPYLLLGFLLAGILHVFVPARFYTNYLSGNGFSSVFFAALFGVPLPLCSCGVIPTAMSLHREGASRGATVSFLIATPQTGIDSIIATYSLLGLPFAIIRPIVALVTAMFGGGLANAFDVKDQANAQKEILNPVKQKKTIFGKILEALDFGLVDMMQDIGKWLVLGLVIAALISWLVPSSFFAAFAEYPLLNMLFVLLISVPMYLCATGSIPIAVALMLKGLTPGAALVLLMAGPATNFASLLVVNKVLGRRTGLIYLISIVLGAVVSGLIIDFFLPSAWFVLPMTQVDACCASEASPEYFNWICSGILVVLLFNALVLRKSHKDCETNIESKEMKKVYKVRGMQCNHCKSSVENAAKTLPGVESVQVDLSTGNVVVNGDFSDSEFRAAVQALGFEVE